MDREYRQYSLLLFREYFAQTNVDLFIDTTANATVGKILTAFGANEIPQFPSEHRRWIVRYSDTIENALRRRRIPAAALWKYPLRLGMPALGSRRRTITGGTLSQAGPRARQV